MPQNPLTFISLIIEKFGPRRAGSEAEKNAQHFIASELKSFCSKVETEEFSNALGAKFSSLKLFCLLYYISLMLPLWSLNLAIAVSAINSIVFFFHFLMYKDWLDVFYPKLTSRNVTGTIEPQGKAKQTIIISGHIDSTPEFIWWYYFSDWGIRIMLVAGAAFVTLPLFYAGSLIFGYQPFLSYGWYCYAFMSVFSLSLFFIHGKIVVDGAQDNLSGVAVALFAAKNLLKDGKTVLQHTRLKIVSFGSEETGLKGSKAYEQKHRETLRNKSYVINLDGILDINEIHIVTYELSVNTRHDKKLVKTLGNALRENGMEIKTGIIPVGATDASSFTRKGIPAVSVVGLALDKLHPTYHTRRDTIEHLNNHTLEKMAKVISDAVVMMDKEISSS